MTEDFENVSVAELKRRGKSPNEVLDAWHRRPLSNRVGSRRFRRRLVVGTYAGWLLIAALIRLITLPFAGWVKPGFAIVMVLVTLNSIISVLWLNRRTYVNTPALVDAELDERLLQIRNQAFRRAFQVFAPVALIGYPLSWAALQWQPNNQGWTNAFLIFSGVALLGTTLPTAIVAWREPDPMQPEESPA
jgi:uncharacterized membrane protein